MKRSIQQLDRQTRILEVAGRCFLESGYAGTTMSRIAAALGGSKQTLWKYFSSKEVLFSAYLDEATSSFRKSLLLDLDNITDVEEALRKFVCRYTRELHSSESISLHRLAIGESARFPEVGRMFYERAPKATAALIAAYMDRQMEAGNLRRADAVEAATTLMSLCMKDRYGILLGLQLPAHIDFELAATQVTADFMRIYKPCT